MGIFGGLFGKKKATFGGGPNPDGTISFNVPIDGGPMPVPSMAEPPKKQNFFGQGGTGRAIAGTIGDVLLQRGGNAPIYGPAMQQQNRLMQQQQQADQQRQQEREDFIWKSQYERANPKPVNNDTVNDLNWYKSLPEEDRKLYHQMKPVVGYMADGTPRIVNPYEVGQQGRGPAPGVVEDGFEFIGGDPANPKSWRPVSGGPVHNVPGGFR